MGLQSRVVMRPTFQWGGPDELAASTARQPERWKPSPWESCPAATMHV